MKKSFKPLTQEDYDTLKPYYEKYTSDVHDLNLTNLLIWRRRHELHFCEIDGYLWFVYYPNNAFNMMFSEPIGDYNDKEALKQSINHWMAFCTQNGYPLRVRHVSDFFKQFLIDLGLELLIHSKEADFDYIYEAVDLANLSGNKFHKKKNHLNQFIKRYEGRYSIFDLNESNAQAALTAARNWCISNGCGETLDLCHEYHGIHEILTNWKTYAGRGLEGVVIFVDEEPVALTFGEIIPNDTFLVHIEKADSSVQGAYTAINHAMANRVAERCLYINREQDMGIEGIRKAKLSYHPHHLVAKYDINL